MPSSSCFNPHFLQKSQAFGAQVPFFAGKNCEFQSNFLGGFNLNPKHGWNPIKHGGFNLNTISISVWLPNLWISLVLSRVSIGGLFQWYPLVMTNSSPWKPWPIEIDGLPWPSNVVQTVSIASSTHSFSQRRSLGCATPAGRNGKSCGTGRWRMGRTSQPKKTWQGMARATFFSWDLKKVQPWWWYLFLSYYCYILGFNMF